MFVPSTVIFSMWKYLFKTIKLLQQDCQGAFEFLLLAGEKTLAEG